MTKKSTLWGTWQKEMPHRFVTLCTIRAVHVEIRGSVIGTEFWISNLVAARKEISFNELYTAYRRKKPRVALNRSASGLSAKSTMMLRMCTNRGKLCSKCSFERSNVWSDVFAAKFWVRTTKQSIVSPAFSHKAVWSLRRQKQSVVFWTITLFELFASVWTWLSFEQRVAILQRLVNKPLLGLAECDNATWIEQRYVDQLIAKVKAQRKNVETITIEIEMQLKSFWKRNENSPQTTPVDISLALQMPPGRGSW